jgi:LysM repeat protein
VSRVIQVLLLVLGLAVTANGVVEAGERKHTVAPGESASGIAKKYYGNFDLTPLLLAYNGRGSTVLQPGEVLRIPYCEVHRVKRGDSWSVLSRRYLKGVSNYAVVAELNGMLPEKPLQPGDEIVFPVFLEHRLERGETLAALAQRYYGQPRQGRLLQESNRLDDPRRLSVGETVQVPLLDFRLTPVVEKVAVAQVKAAEVKKPEPRKKKAKPIPAPTPPPEQEPKPKPKPAADPPAQFAREIRTARELFHAGEFEKSRNLLELIGKGSPSSTSPSIIPLRPARPTARSQRFNRPGNSTRTWSHRASVTPSRAAPPTEGVRSHISTF